jgi:succinate dehydrogenase / fumarate reductase flavoprotein subunit
MGGVLVDYEKDAQNGGMAKTHPKNHVTTIPGLYACGECDSGYHGANRLGANSLLSATFSGMIAGAAAAAYSKNLKKSAADLDEKHYRDEQTRQEVINQEIVTPNGSENAFALHRDLGELMREHVFVERSNEGLDQALAGIKELKERSKKINLDDHGDWYNQSLSWARQVQDMIVMAEVIAKGARMRDECRGSHYKAEFELKVPEGKFEGDPEYEEYKDQWKANNKKWMKLTVATHTADGPKIEYRPFDISILLPEKPRDYR